MNQLLYEIEGWGGEKKSIHFLIEPEFGLHEYLGIVSREIESLEELIRDLQLDEEAEQYAAKPLLPPKKFSRVPCKFNATQKEIKKTDWSKRYFCTQIKKKSEIYGFFNRLIRDLFWKIFPPKEKIRDGHKELEEILKRSSNFVCLSKQFWLANKQNIADYFPENKRAILQQISAPREISDALAVPLKKMNIESLEGWLRCNNVNSSEGCLFVMYENQIKEVTKLLVQHSCMEISSLVLGRNDKMTIPKGWGQVKRLGKNLVYLDEFIELETVPQSHECEMSSLPLISIIIVSYNQARFVKECIDSVLNQDYPNLECIVVDGQSSDGTVEILETYRERLDHLIIEPDKSQSDALNKGFNIATGDVMNWLCSDDLLEVGVLSRIGQSFRKYGTDIVAGGCRIVDSNREHLFNHQNGYPINETSRLSFGDLLSFTGVWERGMCFYQPDLFFTKELWDRSGSYIKEHLYFAMDYDLYLRFAMSGATITHIPDYIASRRVHKDQKTHHDTMSYLPTVRNLMIEYQELLKGIEVV